MTRVTIKGLQQELLDKDKFRDEMLAQQKGEQKAEINRLNNELNEVNKRLCDEQQKPNVRIVQMDTEIRLMRRQIEKLEGDCRVNSLHELEVERLKGVLQGLGQVDMIHKPTKLGF